MNPMMHIPAVTWWLNLPITLVRKTFFSPCLAQGICWVMPFSFIITRSPCDVIDCLLSCVRMMTTLPAAAVAAAAVFFIYVVLRTHTYRQSPCKCRWVEVGSGSETEGGFHAIATPTARGGTSFFFRCVCNAQRAKMKRVRTDKERPERK